MRKGSTALGISYSARSVMAVLLYFMYSVTSSPSLRDVPEVPVYLQPSCMSENSFEPWEHNQPPCSTACPDSWILGTRELENLSDFRYILKSRNNSRPFKGVPDKVDIRVGCGDIHCNSSCFNHCSIAAKKH